MLYDTPSIMPCGDGALLIEYGDEINEAANARVRALDAAIATAAIPGVLETVPAYGSLLVEYDPLRLDYADLRAQVADLDRRVQVAAPPAAGPLKDVPTVYGGEAGPDLAEVASAHGLTPADVVRIHSHQIYTVYMLGFVPGFAYMGIVPESIASGRLAAPRTVVPAGSVGIAGVQTGIYPQASPGGWRLLGRTGLTLFDPYREPPAYFAPGDRVRFVPVDRLEGTGDSAAPLPDNSTLPGTGREPIEVLSPGMLTTVQDLGRPGYRRYGVPVCGAVDAFALQAANVLAGNPPGAAALEATVTGPVLRFHDHAVVAVCGADLDCRLRSVDLGEWAMPLWTAVFVRAGSVLECRTRQSGCRAYIAVAGGIQTPPVMGGQGTYLPGSFGGLAGRALQGGEWLAVGQERQEVHGLAGRTLPAGRRPAYVDAPTVRVVIGPQAGYVSPAALKGFLTQTYAVSATSDRMGLRLQGPAVARTGGRGEMVSGGITLGAVQIPPDGQPIVLLADGQTTGGYPVIATVIRADLPLLAQCLPGAGRISFRPVSVDEAQTVWRAQQSAFLPDELELDTYSR